MAPRTADQLAQLLERTTDTSERMALRREYWELELSMPERLRRGLAAQSLPQRLDQACRSIKEP